MSSAWSLPIDRPRDDSKRPAGCSTPEPSILGKARAIAGSPGRTVTSSCCGSRMRTRLVRTRSASTVAAIGPGSGASPVGIGLRGQLTEADAEDYWRYDALGLPIWVHRDNERAPERPLVFVLEIPDDALQSRRARRGPRLPIRARHRARARSHPRLRRPAGRAGSRAASPRARRRGRTIAADHPGAEHPSLTIRDDAATRVTRNGSPLPAGVAGVIAIEQRADIETWCTCSPWPSTARRASPARAR